MYFISIPTFSDSTAEFKDTDLQHDVWHGAKGITKKTNKVRHKFLTNVTLERLQRY